MTPVSDFLEQPEVKSAVTTLKSSFDRGRLSLYLGAGVSMASGLPSWNTLVAALYYSAVHADWGAKWKPYPNYLFALGEWLLKTSGEPPEVAAGKIETYFSNGPQFLDELIEVLYSPWKISGPPSREVLRQSNQTLDAVAQLCEGSDGGRGLHAVITTNYDDLLERALAGTPAQHLFRPKWKTSELGSCGDLNGGSVKSIFHVHGYLPFGKSKASVPEGSTFNEILLTEAQYHGAARDPYSWSNLCLIHCLSSSVGLVVGMSLTDRNLRRLLYSLSHTRLLETLYLVLKVPPDRSLTTCEVDLIQQKALEYQQNFEKNGLKSAGQVAQDLGEMLKELAGQEKNITEKMFRSFGVEVIWTKDYAEIATLLKAIGSTP